MKSKMKSKEERVKMEDEKCKIEKLISNADPLTLIEKRGGEEEAKFGSKLIVWSLVYFF